MIYNTNMKHLKNLLSICSCIYKKVKRYKTFVAIGIFLLFALYFFQSSDDSNVKIKKYSPEELQNYWLKTDRSNFLINTTNCRIPESDAFGKDIIRFIKKNRYTSCTNLELLSYIEKNSNTVTLKINTSVIPEYNSYGVKCCYSEIHRVSDDEIRFTTCKYFQESIVIRHRFIKVTCQTIFYMTIYENVHAVHAIADDDASYVNDAVNKPHFSVLFVGIDSMSKQNLWRTMPKSYEYLEKHFVNLRGYNKIEDNTFPNIMAILTGENMTQLNKNCPFDINESGDKYEDENFLSKCDFIWKYFRCSGYVTALGEDSTPIGTFNFAKKGFPDPPTDYYYRPYFIAAEQIESSQDHCHPIYCSGPENTGERVMNIVKDFSITFKNRPSVGFFWMNSFSHDNFNCPSTMDEKVLHFLSDPDFVKSLESTIFVFYSDHGFRFGEMRQTHSGWLEERLPFIYLRVPEKFQKQFPKEYGNILTNSYRLTTPYDLHQTLHHLLSLYDDSHKSVPSPGCINCQSLLKEIPETRTCEDASIPMHWCTCIDYNYIHTENSLVKMVAPFVVGEINKLVQSFPEGDKCLVYSLNNVLLAAKSSIGVNRVNEEVVYVLLMINTNRDVVFEATVEVSIQFLRNFRIMGSISRTDYYGQHSLCVENPLLKKYCYCEDIGFFKSKVCPLLNLC